MRKKRDMRDARGEGVGRVGRVGGDEMVGRTVDGGWGLFRSIGVVDWLWTVDSLDGQDRAEQGRTGQGKMG